MNVDWILKKWEVQNKYIGVIWFYRKMKMNWIAKQTCEEKVNGLKAGEDQEIQLDRVSKSYQRGFPIGPPAPSIFPELSSLCLKELMAARER